MADRSLADRFANVANEYEDLKRRCEARVVSWRWATGFMFGDEPYYFERNKYGRSRWLREKPGKVHGAYEYGFDAQGRVVVEREWFKFPQRPPRVSEEFFEHADGVIESARYDHFLHTPCNVKRQTLRAGRVVKIESRARAGSGVDTIEYDAAGLPATLHEIHREGRRATWTRDYRFTHDALGRLTLVEVHGANGWNVQYKRPTKQESSKALAALLEARLLEQIPRAVAAEKVKEPVYCLILGYDWENPAECMPPVLALGLESERQRLAAQHGSKSEQIWNPAELAHFDTKAMMLADKALGETCNLFTQQLAQKDSFAPILKLYLEVAKKLQEHDWSGTLETTDDFIVVPIDYECAHVKKHLAAVRKARR